MTLRRALSDFAAACSYTRGEYCQMRAEKALHRAAELASPDHTDGRRLIRAVNSYAEESLRTMDRRTWREIREARNEGSAA